MCQFHVFTVEVMHQQAVDPIRTMCYHCICIRYHQEVFGRSWEACIVCNGCLFHSFSQHNMNSGRIIEWTKRVKCWNFMQTHSTKQFIHVHDGLNAWKTWAGLGTMSKCCCEFGWGIGYLGMIRSVRPEWITLRSYCCCCCCCNMSVE